MYLHNMELQKTKDLLVKEEFDRWVNDNENAVIFFGHAEDGPEFNEYLYASMVFDDNAKFAHSTDPEIMEHFNVTKLPHIIFMKDFGYEKRDFEGEWDERSIRDFIDYTILDQVFGPSLCFGKKP